MFSHHIEKKPNLHNDYAFKMKRHKAHQSMQLIVKNTNK